MKEIFERVEKKYVLSYEKYESLLKKLDGHIERDKYFNSSIRSIYYDNDAYQMINRSMESPDYKEKIRVRAYEDNAKTVYIECVVIIMINGNMGDGIAVAGSFALIRFRSARGSAKDLTAIFMAMAIGIICGTGYIGIAVLFTLIVCVIGMLLSLVRFGECDGKMRYLKITVPENMNYDEAFEEVLNKYCSNYELEKVKTLSLGSLFRVEYSIVMRDVSKLREMINELRIRNNNLEIVCGKEAISKEEL